MRSPLVACLLAPVLVTACGREDEVDEPDAPVPDVEDACVSDVPVRLAAPPPGWKPGQYDASHRVDAAGSQLIYGWGSSGAGAQSYLIDPCGGPSQALGLSAMFFTVDTPVGPRLYGFSGSDVLLVDRLDEPGLDVPRSIGQVDPRSGQSVSGSYGRLSVELGAQDRPPIPAAGLGARTHAMYVHEGEPLAPLRRVFEGFIKVVRGGANGRLLVLFDSGELRSLDLDSGQDVLVQSGVRYVQGAFNGRTYVWQELGDGLAEAVHLVDVESGAQRQIGVNDFVDRSWGANAEAWTTGRWWWSADGGYLGLIGAGQTLVTVVRAETGEAIEIPEHTAFDPVFPGGFHLTLDEAGERVDALWDPATDELFEFHRGEPAVTPFVSRATDDAVYHVLETDDGPASVASASLWRTDRATGERREVAPRFNGYGARWLPDGRVLTWIDLGEGRSDFLLVDPDAAQTTVLARGVNRGAHVDAERGLYYLDVRGEQPGLWLAPFPPR